MRGAHDLNAGRTNLNAGRHTRQNRGVYRSFSQLTGATHRAGIIFLLKKKDRAIQFCQVLGKLTLFWLSSRAKKKNYPLQRGAHPQPRFSRPKFNLEIFEIYNVKEIIEENLD